MGTAVQGTLEQAAGLQLARIEEARAQALRLQAAAYGPQPVKQPDGSLLPLCWNGRLHRALMLAEAVRAAGDGVKLAQVEGAIRVIGEGMRKAQEAAALAESHYMALCSLAGAPVSLPAVECGCEGCRAQMALHEAAHAGGEVRDAVWALLGAPVGERPVLVELVRRAKEEKARDALWAHLKRIADAFELYEAACAANGEQPTWREVWR